jgi:hypothetical protein
MGIVGENMLLLSFDRMYRVAAFHLVLFMVVLCGPSFALDGKTGAAQDIVTKTKKGDMVTSPQKGRKAAGDVVNASTKKGGSKSDGSASKGTGTQGHSSLSAEPIKPDRNYLDVYVGKCQFTTEAINTVKRFMAEHQNYFVRHYLLKTQSAMPDIAPLKGIELFLPLEAKRFDISNVPTFILNRKGVTYKISGAADLSDVYQEIEKNTVKGEKKMGYIDLGERGKGCKAVVPDLRPAALTPHQRQDIEEENRPPDMRGLVKANRVGMQQSLKPIYSEKQIVSVAAGSKFIVFSSSQADWAIKELKKGASTGCCTDCVDLGRLWPYAQYCSKELLKELGVTSVPTVITLTGIAQQ